MVYLIGPTEKTKAIQASHILKFFLKRLKKKAQASQPPNDVLPGAGKVQAEYFGEWG